MQKRRVKRTKPVRKRVDQDYTLEERTTRAPAPGSRLSAFYAAGPAVRLGTVHHPPENQHEQETEERSRRRAAEDASNDLDPFYVDVDISCESAEERESQSAGRETEE
jgi:hypothetical protein